MAKKVLASNWTVLAALILIVIGFRLAAQVGQGLDAIQNDGYAGSGGLLILAGGVLVGLHVGINSWGKNRGKG